MDNIAGFWSYTRSDDMDDGRLRHLREYLGKALALQQGEDILVWQDIQSIPHSEHWVALVTRAISQTDFFLPIVTPYYLHSAHCLAELQAYRKEMQRKGLQEKIFPIHYFSIENIHPDETVFRREIHELMKHPLHDFRPLRAADLRTREVLIWVDNLAEHILDAVRRDKSKLIGSGPRASLLSAETRVDMLSKHASLFISYGGSDEVIASRINDALKLRGIKTWFFPDDALPGDKLHRVMHEGVNSHDSTFLICSRASLVRPGVLNELERVLEREAKEGGGSLLLPVALDDYVFTSWTPRNADVAAQVRSRVICKISNPESDLIDFEKVMNRLQIALEFNGKV